MSVCRIMGTETEFGVIAPEKPEANPTVLSAQVVNTYDTMFRRELASTNTSTWEYDSESPLADARGFEMEESEADASQLTHRRHELTSEDIAAEALAESGMFAERLDWDAVTMNSILPNGARFYVDHAHPEYSSPEITSPMDAVLWDAAGDYIAAQTVETIARLAPQTGLPIVNLYKNNADSKGQSYGFHENYQIRRDVDFDSVITGLLPFFVSRQIITGAGRVGLGVNGERPGFQISQRADFFERTVGLETTIRRPIINTRDEPHADQHKYRRLHVIVGDANLSHYSTLLKFGTTSAVLGLIEAGAAPHIKLADPVAAIHTVSHDLDLEAELPLAGGGSTTALEIQHAYLAAARAWDKNPDQHTQRVFDLWEETLDALENDLFSLADRLDWVAKYFVLRQYVSKGVGWDDPKLAAIDLQYSDVRPGKGLYHKLVQLGRMRTLFTPEQIADAAAHPPEDTRAFLRGRLISTFPDQVVSANWDTLVVRTSGKDGVVRYPMQEPLHNTKVEVAEHLDQSRNASDLMRRLERAVADAQC